MASQALGDRLFTWLQAVWAHASDVPPLSFFVDLQHQFQGFIEGKPVDAGKVAIDTLGAIPTPPTLAAAMALSALSGKPMPIGMEDFQREASKMMQDPSGYLATRVQEIEANADVQAAGRSISAMLEQFIWTPLQSIAARTEENPVAVAVEIQAAIQAVTLAGHVIGAATELLSLGQVETVDEAFRHAIEVSGLAEVGAIATMPLFESGVRPAAERFYNNLYRPARLGIEQLVTLQALGFIDEGYVNDEAAKEGYRDVDIAFVRELIYDRIAPGDILNARDLGQIDDQTALDWLQKKRIHPDDARFLLQMHEVERLIGWGERVFNLALRTYAKYQMDDDALRRVAIAANFPPERIDFEIRLAQMERQGQQTDLAVGQIESAFKAGALSEVETANYLGKIHIDPSGIAILIQTWKLAIDKTPQRLNAAELTTAFHDGIIDDKALHSKLVELGWNTDDARILVEIAKWRSPEKPRPLSEGVIVTAFHKKIVSNAEAIALLEKIGFGKDDAAFLLRAETILPTQKQKELTTAEIAKLVELEVLTSDAAIARFVAMGYSQDDAELLLIALTTAKPKAPKQSKPKAKPVSTTPKGGA